MATEKEEGVWYQCQRCTNCCKWGGDVVLTDEDLVRISGYLGMEMYDFVRDYTRLRGNRMGLSLIDKDGTTECIMLDGEDCRIQEVKPRQCSGFPNTWNFKGWRKVCEAIPVKKEDV